MRTVRSTVVGENADDKEQLPPEQDCTDQRWNLSSANAYGMMSRLAVSIYKGTAPVPVVGRLTKAAVSMAEKTLTWSGLPRLLEGEELLRDDSSCTSFIVIDTKLRHAFLLLDEKIYEYYHQPTEIKHDFATSCRWILTSTHQIVLSIPKRGLEAVGIRQSPGRERQGTAASSQNKEESGLFLTTAKILRLPGRVCAQVLAFAAAAGGGASKGAREGQRGNMGGGGAVSGGEGEGGDKGGGVNGVAAVVGALPVITEEDLRAHSGGGGGGGAAAAPAPRPSPMLGGGADAHRCGGTPPPPPLPGPLFWRSRRSTSASGPGGRALSRCSSLGSDGFQSAAGWASEDGGASWCTGGGGDDGGYHTPRVSVDFDEFYICSTRSRGSSLIVSPLGYEEEESIKGYHEKNAGT